SSDERLSPYYRAKGWADVWLRRSELIHTVVRPGRLTEEEGAGTVEVADSLPSGGSISRDDVARILVDCLDEEDTEGKTFAVVEGPTPIREALERI
ncbi:MAG: NAD(P)H-binding protein, partial [Gemmatimonadota bacterium]